MPSLEQRVARPSARQVDRARVGAEPDGKMTDPTSAATRQDDHPSATDPPPLRAPATPPWTAGADWPAPAHRPHRALDDEPVPASGTPVRRGSTVSSIDQLVR